MIFFNRTQYKEVFFKEPLETKYEYIQIRVSPKEKEEIKALAKLQHLSVSSLIRWLVLSKYKNDLIRDNS